MELRVPIAAVTAEAEAAHFRRDDALFDGVAADNASNDHHNNFPEIDCVRSLLSVHVLAEAEDRATRLGIGADRFLIASGALTEEAYLRRLGDALGVKFEPLTDIPRTLCRLTDERLIAGNIDGLLSLTIDDEIQLVLAPRETQARWLTRLIHDDPSLAKHFRLATSEQFSHFILRCAGNTLLTNAVDLLRQRWPELSAGPPRRIGRFVFAVVVTGLALIGASLLTHSSILIVLEVVLAVFFLSWIGLRLASAFVTRRETPPALQSMTDASLPVYSIIAALYDEAKSVDELLHRFEQLNYPAERLDIILAIEASDHATRVAIESRKTHIPIRVITCPNQAPHTKPKALNMALPFARGDYTVIYDAEDRPELDQLRRALQAFYAAGDDLVCVQARLCIDNTGDSWLTRFFTAEYAGHFDIFLGGLAKMRFPLPLGGSSNHFRTDKLREIGAWDPYNVTEDADLGVRLARFGYRSDVIFSTTYEEAPAHFIAWLKQRTRWFKGWMQTWAVHMRHPLQLKRELGLPGFMAFQLIVGGNAFAALVHLAYLLFLAVLVVATALGFVSWHSHSFTVYAALCGTILGYGASIFIGWLGLARRKLTSITSVLLLTPVHWVLLSFAAWRALRQFVFSPYVWEKTEHGIAKSSRFAAAMTQSLLLLGRQLQDMEMAGKLPSLGDGSHAPNRIHSAAQVSDGVANKRNAEIAPPRSFTAAAAPSPHAPGKIGQPPRQVRTPEQNSVPRTGPPQSSRSFLLCQNLPTAESLDD